MGSIIEFILMRGQSWFSRITTWLFWLLCAGVAVAMCFDDTPGQLTFNGYIGLALVVIIFWATAWAFMPGFRQIGTVSVQQLERRSERGVYDSKAEVWNVEEWTSTGGYRKYQVPEKNPPLGD